MRLSTRTQLLKEAEKVLNELKREGSSFVYTSDEVTRIKQSIGQILNFTQDAIQELNESESALKTLRANLEDSANGNSLTTTQMTQFMKNVFGYNKQAKSVSKLSKETQRLAKMIGR